MRVWWTTAYYELLKYSRMRSMVLLLVGLPLLLILLLGSAFNKEIKPAKVALYIEDAGELRAGMDGFWADASIKPFAALREAASEQEVQDLVKEGVVDYGVYVPGSFSEQIVAGESAVWKTYSGRYEEKNIAADAIVSRYMANLNLQLAAHRTLGPDYIAAQLQESGGADGGSVPGIRIGNIGNGADRIFGQASSMQYYASAYLIMFLLYGGMSAAIALLNQKEAGTLHRLYALPSSFGAIVFGIIAGSVMLAALQAIVIIAVTAFGYGVDWGHQAGWLAVICLLTSLTGAGLAIVIASFAKTRKTTQTLFSVLALVMTFLSGGMVAGIQNELGAASRMTINHWANAGVRAIMNGSDISSVWSEFGVLALIAAALSLLAALRLPKVVKQHG